MKNGTCPKCQSTDIAHIKDEVGIMGGDNNIQLGATVLSIAKVMRLVCLSCGYLEQWVESEHDLEKIRKKYQ